MRKPITVALLVILPLLLLGLAGVSQAQLVLYDDFSVKPINPAKWFGSERQFGPGAPDTETTRKIANGQIEIDLTTYGRADSDTGFAGFSDSSLQVTNPAPIRTLQVDVTIKNVKVVGCAANPTPTRSRALVVGGFFNDGTSPAPGDRTGDIVAGMDSRRDSIFGDVILAFIARCTNALCTTSTSLTFAVFTATWTKGVPDTFRMQWLPSPINQFVFTLNPAEPNPETKTLSYTVSDTTPPVLDFKLLQDSNAVANCLSGPRTSATVKALFDNVMVNP